MKAIEIIGRLRERYSNKYTKSPKNNKDHYINWLQDEYAELVMKQANGVEQSASTCNLQNVNARAFVESCGDMTEYVDGTKIAKRFTKFTIPVIEYNELRQAADKWDSEHVR